MKAELINCRRCGSDACYELNEDKQINWFCFGCGFVSNTQANNIIMENYKSSKKVPQLYKDLIFKDELDLYWYPSNINVKEKGMLFIDGNSIDNWRWSAIKTVPILEEEKHKFPKGTEYKTDLSTKKEFNEEDFMEGLDYINYFG